MSAESIAQVREWAAQDRAAAEAKRRTVASVADQVVALQYFSGLATEEAEKSRLVAQAAELEAAGDADGRSAATLDAAADGWETIADAAEAAVDDPDQH